MFYIYAFHPNQLTVHSKFYMWSMWTNNLGIQLDYNTITELHDPWRINAFLPSQLRLSMGPPLKQQFGGSVPSTSTITWKMPWGDCMWTRPLLEIAKTWWATCRVGVYVGPKLVLVWVFQCVRMIFSGLRGLIWVGSIFAYVRTAEQCISTTCHKTH